MKLFLFSALILVLVFSVEGYPDRSKRDITCATFGHQSCEWSCKLRGRKGGVCAWDDATGAYNCTCDKERRGVRCNVGGENTCHITCVMLGHTEGVCDPSFKCNCSGENNRLGSLYENIGNRL
ncbi:uncharacterized protein LOC111715588 [Eurytemora carolleeae]|uniref:uncharacterized protein LOC111715588 n=1 Tax=Eurytemora carolleeae TaxID=1294199 RepID=UPI000C766648|nr:uncharacterized protein LOC111715588 [Eurytemora carolleeae]|eukprot:XP_023346719.1 uncharacterized protein LOC111715588 [Eurytemora affinis]